MANRHRWENDFGFATTGTAAAADTDMCDASSLSLAVSHPADTVGVHTPDSDSSRAHPLSSSVSPSGSGGKWTHHISSDRDSPYVSVMALASTCHLFSESCPTAASGDDDDTALGYYNQVGLCVCWCLCLALCRSVLSYGCLS